MKFLDTTVLPDLLIRGLGSKNSSFLYVLGLTEQIAISIMAVPVLLREGHKVGISNKTMFALLGRCRMVSVEKQDYEWALANARDRDFQGALQVAAALREECSGFVTTDLQRSRDYSEFLSIDHVGVSLGHETDFR